MSKKTLPSLFIGTVLLASVARMAWVGFILRNKSTSIVIVVLVPLMLILVFTSFYRYWQGLKFRVIADSFPADANRRLIQQFLASEHLAVYRHPEVADVFQIMSRPLGNNTDEREVMVFIADDNRVLLNSHFIGQKFVVNTTSGNSKMMARRFKEWIAARNSSPSADMMTRP